MLRRTSHRKSFVWPILWFALGWISLVIALDSPLHELGRAIILGTHDAARDPHADLGPLLVLGRPMIAFLWALPPAWRDKAAGLGAFTNLQERLGLFSAPLSAWLVSALALWIWHIPSLFDQTLRSDWIHAAQHTTFLVTALAFWWPVVNRTSDSRLWRRSGVRLHDDSAYQRPGRVAYVCTAGLVFVLRDDCSGMAPQRARRSTDRRTDHVDPSRDTAADCGSSFAR